MSYIREDVRILQSMEQRLESELKLSTSNFQGLYDSLSQFSSQWISNIEKQEATLKKLSGVLSYRAQESNTIHQRLDYAKEFMSNAQKADDKLQLKKQKYLDEKQVHKWDNIELSNTFSDDQIIKVF